eukprot:1324395-Ditylum_brightwellii.AAC.2
MQNAAPFSTNFKGKAILLARKQTLESLHAPLCHLSYKCCFFVLQHFISIGRCGVMQGQLDKAVTADGREG